MRAFTSLLLAATSVSSSALAEGSLIGFTDAHASAERVLESKFDANLSASDIRERLKDMASAPNQVGSPHDKANAEKVLAELKAWGWDAHMEVFSVLYPTPLEEKLELTGANPYSATLREPAIPGDETSAHQDGGLPAYLAYQGDGDVNAPLIYVNYGMPADYAALQRLGLDVRGKIVIVRYGSGWRGLKPKLAAQHGAVGCIIYSDPADDGYGAGDAYPAVAFRPEWGVQRGSVLDMPVKAGDPGTRDAPTVLTIPALPISWGDAKHFLAALGGPVAPKTWRGALGQTYHVGGDDKARVHLLVRSDWSQKPLYDVIALMKGAREPDQWVVRGNHRDGWVFGAEDPLSGQTALLEEAKSLGALSKTGWRPARTIVYASWDGEEPALLGSTAWAQAHADALKARALVYVNTDGNNRGLLQFEASYSLGALINQTAADVADPETGADLRKRAMAGVEIAALATDATAELKSQAKLLEAGGALPGGDMGSGSDYTPFVQHLGIASINLGFGGEGQSGGVYHSAYDTFEHYDRFGDPGMIYGVALAKTAGRLVLRAADADLAPLRFSAMAARLAAQTAELKTLVGTEREHSAILDRLLDENGFALAADPTRGFGSPDRESVAPDLDFSPLDGAIGRLTASAKAFDAAAASVPDAGRAARADVILQGAEQAVTDDQGLPGRGWYKHLLYAPGLLTGYGAKTLPGVREAIEGRRRDEARDYIRRTGAALNTLSAKLDVAANLLAP